MLPKENISVGIVGLGLIGGSLAKLLASKGYRVTGIAHSDSTLQKAKNLDIFTTVSKDIDDLEGCELIFVATPINKITDIFKELETKLTSPVIVTDVASIKGDIVDAANEIFTSGKITFIAGHPMAGTEFKGIDNAYLELFDGAVWVLCPGNPSQKKQIELLVYVIEETGARIIYANPYTHDMAVALISHMPLMVSLGLIEAVESREDLVLKELAYYLAASGFRDTTRIAGGNPELSLDMLKFNQKNVLKALDNFEDSIKHLKELLNGDRETAIEKLEELASVRKNLYSPYGKNAFKGLSG